MSNSLTSVSADVNLRAHKLHDSTRVIEVGIKLLLEYIEELTLDILNQEVCIIRNLQLLIMMAPGTRK